mgnify:CR=1 FL=1
MNNFNDKVSWFISHNSPKLYNIHYKSVRNIARKYLNLASVKYELENEIFVLKEGGKASEQFIKDYNAVKECIEDMIFKSKIPEWTDSMPGMTTDYKFSENMCIYTIMTRFPEFPIDDPISNLPESKFLENKDIETVKFSVKYISELFSEIAQIPISIAKEYIRVFDKNSNTNANEVFEMYEEGDQVNPEHIIMNAFNILKIHFDIIRFIFDKLFDKHYELTWLIIKGTKSMAYYLKYKDNEKILRDFRVHKTKKQEEEPEEEQEKKSKICKWFIPSTWYYYFKN